MSAVAVAVDALVGLVTGGTGGYLLYVLARDGVRTFESPSRALIIGVAAAGLVLYAVSVVGDALAGRIAGGALFMPAVAILFLWYAMRSRRSEPPPPESGAESER